MNQKPIFQPKFHSPQSIRGSTLIEVMISVFLLTFGVLGLMAAQIRSVASIGEAESRSVIAQAAENLMEGMQVNPQILSANNHTVRDYRHYLTAPKSLDLNTLPDPTNPINPLWGQWSATAAQSVPKISKQAVANSQIALFEYMLQQTPNAQSIEYTICNDTNPIPAEPTVNGNQVNFNCQNGNNGSAVVKVAWTNRPANNKSQQTPVYYTYQLKLSQ